MKLKFFTLLMFAFCIQNAIGQNFQKAPVNKKFDEFIKSKSQAKGVIPSPMVYHFDNMINEKSSKFTFPSSYDLRSEGLLTSVKDQGEAGHCWTFAAMAAIESRNLKFGLGSYDLSEHNLATCHGFEWEEGGNNDMAAAYFTRLSGPLLETEDPYNDIEFSCSATDTDPQFYLPEVTYLPRNPEVIKYYLMNYGAISVGYHENYLFLNNLNNTYYYSGSDNINHGVTLVGWDDEKVTGGGTGAWIIKNSWGAGSRENGYFYMSYNDTYAIYDPMIFPVRQELNNIDTLLMYDKFGAITSYGFGDNDAFGLVKYNVTQEMHFSKIGTYINATNTYIDIEVFQTKTDNILTDTLAKSYGLFVEYPGYHTFDVPFNANGDVYIKVKYNTPGYRYPVPVETKYAGYVVPTIESNVGWISNSGETWTAIGTGTDAEVDLCIRAYATDKEIEASFTADYETICSTGSVTYTSTSNGAISNYYWDFGLDASPAAASTEGPHTVSYSSEGFKTIKLVVENASGDKDSIINYNFVKVNSEIEVKIAPLDSFNMSLNDTIELRASGAASYEWFPAASIIGSSLSATVEVSPLETTYFKVVGTMNECEGVDSVKIIVSQKPINDDVCDAIELSIDETHGPFSNYLATVQENEPFPDTTGMNCETPGYWCSEGGLQNSIWFKFVAPNSGAVSIETDGFDNQIAVYDTENCYDIVSGDDNLYEIIAANDDYIDEDYSATIVRVENLTEGKTYWLQIDGSAGGATGECTVLINKIWHSSTEQQLNNEQSIKVYPNPNNGIFKIDLNNIADYNKNDIVNIEIIGIDGTIQYKYKGFLNERDFNLSISNKGYYFVNVIINDVNYVKPIIVK